MAIEYYDSLNVASTAASTFAGDVLIEDNLYLTDAGTTRAKIQLNSSDRDDLDINAVSLGSNVKFFTVNTERMRIDANGNIGIGTSSPGYKLHNTGTSRLEGRVTLGGNVNNFIEGLAGSIDFKSAGNFNFIKGANTLLTILETGNVGIGTTSPSAPLDVRRSDASGVVAEFNNNVGFGININVESDGGVNTIASGSNQSLAFVTNGGTNERMRIGTTGNVGIGTDAPAHTLDVKGVDTDDATLARFYSNTGTRGSFVIKNGTATTPTTFIGTAGGGEQLSIGTNSTESIRIGGSGNVGIGTNAPGEKLEVAGNIKLGDNNKLLFGAGNDLEIFHDGSNSLIKDVGTGFLIIESDAALVLQNGAGEAYLQAISNGQVNLYYNGNKKFETTSTGVTVTGTVDLTNLTVSSAQGTDGQVLTSTGSGVAWEDVSGGSSPWTTDTNGITYTAGNVGIGAASQASTDLRVGGFARFNGDVRFDGDVQCAGGDLIVNNSLKDVNSATGTSGQILSSEGAGGGVEWIDAGVKSSTSGEPSGSDSVINIVSLTQAEYDAGTPVATTLYIIT